MRISKKIVLDYLESVYPDWKNFEQITDEVPVMFNFDVLELQDRLDRLCVEGKIEKEYSSHKECLGEWQRYRINHIKE
jgi:hypothetical protein